MGFETKAHESIKTHKGMPVHIKIARYYQHLLITLQVNAKSHQSTPNAIILVTWYNTFHFKTAFQFMVIFCKKKLHTKAHNVKDLPLDNIKIIYDIVIVIWSNKLLFIGLLVLYDEGKQRGGEILRI